LRSFLVFFVSDWPCQGTADTALMVQRSPGGPCGGA